jgi:hypothetical protein
VSTPRLHLLRPFNWGLLLISDQSTHDLPHPPPAAPDIASATRSAVTIGVRHAQDSDLADEQATVSINVFIGVEPDTAVDFTTDLDIASGVLDIGDAEQSERLELGTGRWRLALLARPADHPDDITVWLNRHTQPTAGAESSRHAGANSD